MPNAESGVSGLASPLDASTAEEVIPGLARHGLHRLAFYHSNVLRRALTSLRSAYRRTSSGFGPAAAPGLLFWGGWHQLS
jgi:hypothetical protein